jgi:hypothetical protein
MLFLWGKGKPIDLSWDSKNWTNWQFGRFPGSAR